MMNLKFEKRNEFRFLMVCWRSSAGVSGGNSFISEGPSRYPPRPPNDVESAAGPGLTGGADRRWLIAVPIKAIGGPGWLFRRHHRQLDMRGARGSVIHGVVGHHQRARLAPPGGRGWVSSAGAGGGGGEGGG